MGEVKNQKISPVQDKTLNDMLDFIGVLFFVMGGIIAFFALSPIIYLAIGLLFSFIHAEELGNAPKFFGLIFIIVSSFSIIVGETIAILIIIAGKRIRQRRNYIFCVIMTGVLFLFSWLGIALGVFALIYLIKDETKELFNKNKENGEN